MKKKQPGRKRIKPEKAIFEMMYSKLPARELAKHYGVTEQTIFNWAHDFREEERKNNNV